MVVDVPQIVGQLAEVKRVLTEAAGIQNHEAKRVESALVMLQRATCGTQSDHIGIAASYLLQMAEQSKLSIVRANAAIRAVDSYILKISGGA